MPLRVELARALIVHLRFMPVTPSAWEPSCHSLDTGIYNLIVISWATYPSLFYHMEGGGLFIRMKTSSESDYTTESGIAT